jgi:hypothetical protein
VVAGCGGSISARTVGGDGVAVCVVLAGYLSALVLSTPPAGPAALIGVSLGAVWAAPAVRDRRRARTTRS